MQLEHHDDEDDREQKFRSLREMEEEAQLLASHGRHY